MTDKHTGRYQYSLRDHIVLWLLALYQRYLSPYKGFKCAYGVLHGHGTCSAMAKRIITHDGVVAGWPQIRQQLRDCSQSYQVLQTLAVGVQSPAQFNEEIIRWRKRDEPDRQSWFYEVTAGCTDLAIQCGCDRLAGLGCDACDCAAV
jgi:putative component of membrane protein insertase Oxa1/YidC/SpoIIIJ protein YidD